MKKKKIASKKRERKAKEEVCEIFNVENKGKEETIKSCGVEDEIIEKAGQIDEEKKILKKVLIVIGILSVVLIAIALIVYFNNNFEYRGTKFQVKKEGKLILYNTFIPVKYTDSAGKTTDANYNFYIRNDPRKLDKINFEGEIKLSKTAVMNITGTDFNCDGDGVIGIANLQKMYNVLGVEVIKDEKAGCDSEGRYMFIQIQPGEENSIKQTSQLCYVLTVKDCDILKVTERMMVETLVRYNEVKIKNN